MHPTKIRRLEAEAPNLASKQVTVVVGTNDYTKTFCIHEDVMRCHSDFFAAALNKDWKEAEEGVVRLPHDSYEEIEVFTRFVYTGRIYTAKPKHEGEDVDGKIEAGRLVREFGLLRDCWINGDKLLSVNFKDAVLDAIIQLMQDEKMLPTVMHELVYPYTSGPNGLRRLLVDVAVWGWCKEILADRKVDASWMEFFHDLAMRFREVGEEQRKLKAPYYLDSCKYHEHVAAGKPCYRSLFP